MLVQSPVIGDARVVREATALAEASHDVTVVGRDVPADVAPAPGWRLLSVGRAAGLGSTSQRSGHPATEKRRAATAAARRTAVSAARWTLLPTHVARVEKAWRDGARRVVEAAVADGTMPRPQVVHAHDLWQSRKSFTVSVESREGVTDDIHVLPAVPVSESFGHTLPYGEDGGGLTAEPPFHRGQAALLDRSRPMRARSVQPQLSCAERARVRRPDRT